MESLGFSMYRSMSSANSEFYFFSNLDSFLFLLLLLWLKLPKLCWIVVVRVGIRVLFLTLGENAFNFSPLRIMFAVVYHIWLLLCEVCSFYACFLGRFYHKCMLNFVKGFLSIYWDYYMVFIFQFVNLVYHINSFANIDESLHLLDKAHLVMMYDLFNMLLDSVC